MKKLLSITLTGLFALGIARTSFGGGNDQCFLKIDGIAGESNNSLHPNEIELVGFRTGLMEKIVNSASGATVGSKPDFSPLKVFKYIDKASIPILVACATGKHLKKTTLSVVHNGSVDLPTFNYFVVVLSDVLVSSVNDGTETTDGQGNLLETVTFEFAKIEWTYTPVEDNGMPGTPVKGGFDVKLNKKL